MRMPAFARVLLCLLLAAPQAWAIDAVPPLPDEGQQARYLALTREMRCLKCMGETVADTSAMFAVDIRRQVREMIVAGRSDEQIRQYMVDRYGEVILLRPRWSAHNAWLWLAPGIFLLSGGIVAWRVLRQRRELLDSDDSPVDETSSG
ncbi:MAG: cytochrome c-type biogenesis protein CcmH [Steroidobacteraceae bacterium]